MARPPQGAICLCSPVKAAGRIRGAAHATHPAFPPIPSRVRFAYPGYVGQNFPPTGR